MNHEELFVGAVAIVLGVLGVAAAIANWDDYYQVRKMRWIEDFGGRECARLVYALLGLTLIALGIAIALGFGPNKSTGRARSSSRERVRLAPEVRQAVDRQVVFRPTHA